MWSKIGHGNRILRRCFCVRTERIYASERGHVGAYARGNDIRIWRQRFWLRETYLGKSVGMLRRRVHGNKLAFCIAAVVNGEARFRGLKNGGAMLSTRKRLSQFASSISSTPKQNLTDFYGKGCRVRKNEI